MAEKEYISREAALSAQNKSMNLSECRKRLERIPAADVRPKWISVDDALPELHDEEYLDEVTGEVIHYKESKPILIWLAKGGFMDIGVCEKSDSVDDFCYQGVPHTVTYWMPLPEPPKEEMSMNTCADCYWYSDITFHVCELEKEPTSADQEACPMFEQKEE